MSTRNSSRLRRQQIQVTLSRRASTPASSTDRAARQISTENNSRFSRGRSNPPQENSNTSRNQNKSILNNSNDVRARLRPRLNSTYPTRAATHFQNITNQLPVAFFNIDSSDSEVEEVPDKVQVIDLSNDEIQAKETQQPAMIRGHETICPICFGKAREHPLVRVNQSSENHNPTSQYEDLHEFLEVRQEWS